MKEVVERGAIPTTLDERRAFLDRRVGGYRLLGDARERVDGRIYSLHAEHLAYHGHGRLIGDWMGPYRYDLAYAALATNDPAASLKAFLRSIDADALLVRLDGVVGAWPLDDELGCLERVAEDTHANDRYVLYVLRPTC